MQLNKAQNQAVGETQVEVLEPHHRRDFCMLILKLIQCPDMEYDELEELLDSGQYSLLPKHVKNFRKEVTNLVKRDVGSIMEIMSNLDKLLMDQMSMAPNVNRSSPIGVFLRRVMLFFDKLTFSQSIGMYCAYQHYVIEGRKKMKWKKDCLTPTVTQQLSLTPSLVPVSPPPSVSEIEIETTCNFDMSLGGDDFTSSPAHIQDMNSGFGDDRANKYMPGVWSRRQAELFIARQSALLQNNENSALPPPDLQDKIRKVLQANPEHAEAHYLSYLNCLRVKEFGGAVDSLYHFFDRTALISNQEDKIKGFRYAALNLAILHAKFGHIKEALNALKDAITLSHEANDNICLQHAQAWLYKLTDENKEILMERSISKCSDLSLNYLTSLGLQSFAQFAGTTGGKPALVFEVLMRSDVLNCQFSMMDLMANSFAHKSALWTLYGKSEMASLSSQLLLHLDTSDLTQGLTAYNGEATCQAICNVLNRLTDQGQYALAQLVAAHAKSRFPNSTWWLLSEQILYFTQALHQGRWQAAEMAVKQIATLNKWESLLRHGELLLAKGDNKSAMAAVTTVLDAGPNLCPSVRVRALLLAARGSRAASVSILTAALSIANYHYLDYLTALVAMHLAELQLQMGLPAQALKLMDQSLLVVLSHGGHYDQAQAMSLFVKCKVASSATVPQEIRTEVIAESVRLLKKVRECYKQVEAYSKVKETVYLQALLSHEIGYVKQRNRCAMEFRQLDEQCPTHIGKTM